MNKRRLLVCREIQLQEAVITAAVTILGINGSILWAATMSPGLGLGRMEFSATNCILLALVELFVLFTVILIALRRTQRTLGPVEAITRELIRLGEGDLSARIQLRHGDAGSRKVAEMNKAFEALSERLQRVRHIIEQLELIGDAREEQVILIAELKAELAQFITHESDGSAVEMDECDRPITPRPIVSKACRSV